MTKSLKVKRGILKVVFLLSPFMFSNAIPNNSNGQCPYPRGDGLNYCIHPKIEAKNDECVLHCSLGCDDSNKNCQNSQSFGYKKGAVLTLCYSQEFKVLDECSHMNSPQDRNNTPSWLPNKP